MLAITENKKNSKKQTKITAMSNNQINPQLKKLNHFKTVLENGITDMEIISNKVSFSKIKQIRHVKDKVYTSKLSVNIFTAEILQAGTNAMLEAVNKQIEIFENS